MCTKQSLGEYTPKYGMKDENGDCVCFIGQRIIPPDGDWSGSDLNNHLFDCGADPIAATALIHVRENHDCS